MASRTGIAAGIGGLAVAGALLVWAATAAVGVGGSGGPTGPAGQDPATPGPGGTPPSGGTQYTAFSHAPDYSWVAGRLTRSSLEGGFWIIEYLPEGAPPDRYRGRFVLGTPPQLAGFNDGDLVVVFGSVGQNQASIFMAGTVYELDRVQRL